MRRRKRLRLRPMEVTGRTINTMEALRETRETILKARETTKEDNMKDSSSLVEEVANNAVQGWANMELAIVKK